MSEAAAAAKAPAEDAVCGVADLTVVYYSDGEWLRAVRDVTFRVNRGEILAIVGETGSGKSTTATAMIRMLPSNGRVADGRVTFESSDLLALSEKQMRGLRGQSVAYIPQQPMSAFNPTMKIGRQVAEPLLIHRGLHYKEAHAEAAKRLNEMGIRNVERVMDSFPHQLSGGMLQRAMIATAMILQPKLLIADEPTSALDVTIQRQILSLIRRVQRDYDLAVVLISHDLSVVSQIADRILVLYGGRLVEIGPTASIVQKARHPYTRGLLQSAMSAELDHKARIPSLPGYPPNPMQVDAEPGCPFRPRCTRALEACAQEFPAAGGVGRHQWACHNPIPE